MSNTDALTVVEALADALGTSRTLTVGRWPDTREVYLNVDRWDDASMTVTLWDVTGDGEVERGTYRLTVEQVI